MNRREFIAAGLLGLAITGCQKGAKSPRGVVKLGGKVTYGGTAPPKGFFLTFKPTGEGKQSSAVTKDGGEFYCRYSTTEDGVEHGQLKVTVGWDDEANGGPVPTEFADLVKSYGAPEDALDITVEKADTSYKLDFPKK